MDKIFVAGAGTMGLNIASVFASYGMTVTVRDISEDIISAADAKNRAKFEKLVSRGRLARDEAEAILSRMSFTTDVGAAKDAELVLEAVVENMAVKKNVFRELDEVCSPAAIFATNTSSKSVTELAASVSNPERFIGMHFFNPADRMELVEVIRGAQTSEETFQAVFELARAIGKDPIDVEEAPGFVVNRLLTPILNDAIQMLYEGVASAEDIDKAMRLGANHPMGPLELCDLVGLDVVLSVVDTLFDETRDPKYRACPLLRKMVRAGMLGRKTGRGFYEYK